MMTESADSACRSTRSGYKIVNVTSTTTPNTTIKAYLPTKCNASGSRVVIMSNKRQSLTPANNNPTTSSATDGGAQRRQAQEPIPQKKIILSPPTDTRIFTNLSATTGDAAQAVPGSDELIDISNAQAPLPQTINVTVADGQGMGGEGLYSQLQYVSDANFGATSQHDPYGLTVNPVNQLHGGNYTVYAGEPPYNAYHPQYSSVHSPGAQSGTTYIISPGGVGQHCSSQASPNSIDGEDSAQHLSHTTRASPATIQWLLHNYETAEGVSLPRCTLYTHYLRHCQENKLDPVNAASFGKLIRSVFLGLRTRRLGTRGNSKYHYYGIRIKPDSPLNGIGETDLPMAMRQQPTNPSRRGNRSMTAASNNCRQEFASPTSEHSSTGGVANEEPTETTNLTTQAAHKPEERAHSPVDTNRQYLGVGFVPKVAHHSGAQLADQVERMGLTSAHVDLFFRSYRQHCEEIVEHVSKLQLTEVDHCWRVFWGGDEMDDEDEFAQQLGSLKSGLSQTQLFSVCTLRAIQEYVESMDLAFYQSLIDILVPNVLNAIPSSLTQSIRNFAKGLENSLCMAMQGAPEQIQKIKLMAVSSLAQTLRRYTSLNHLAQAARAVLQHPAQINQMLADLNRVDFRNVQEQASWVCQCDPLIVERLEKDFKATLGKQKSLEQWAQWLEAVVDQVLAPYFDRCVAEIESAAKSFLLKWSFYSSMIIRDLTLRSAASFGSFHLIRLLFDEYMFYLVEQRLAKIKDHTTVAVMAQMGPSYPLTSINEGVPSYANMMTENLNINTEQQPSMFVTEPTAETHEPKCEGVIIKRPRLDS